jgi:hypothetical protein
MSKQNFSLVIIAALLIVAAAFSRLILYPFNYSPIIGMALFGGSVISNKRLAFALPLIAMFLSDVLFEAFKIAPGFWGWGQLLHYGIYALITVMGFGLKRINVLNVAGFSIAASIVFFLLSNSVFFLTDNPIYHLYPNNAAGYVDCLIGGLPFLKNGLLTDLVYSSLLFGGYYLMEKRVFSKATA